MADELKLTPDPHPRWRTRRPAVAKAYRTTGGRRWHVVRAERALGKPLPKGAVVHHADGTKRDDAPLVICQDERYHRYLHQLLRIKQAGGDPFSDRICPTCQRVLAFAAFPGTRRDIGSRCNECNRQHVRDAKARRGR